MRNAITLKNSTTNSNLIKVVFGLMLCTLLLVGCSSTDSNPMDPGDGNTEPPVEEIKKPTKITINSIKVTRTKDKEWDPSAILRSSRKGDLFVKMGLSGGNVDYESNVVNNVNPNSSYTFTNKRGLTGKSLPMTYLYVDRIRIEMWDNDTIGDDLMGVVTFSPSSLYNNDEATTFSKSFSGSNNSRITVKGTFRY